MPEILTQKLEGAKSYLAEAIGPRRPEFMNMIRDAARLDPLYKPTLIHPEHLLGVILTANEFPPDFFSGPNAALQEKIFTQNFETIVTMLPDMVEANYKLRKAGYTFTENPLYYRENHSLLQKDAEEYAEVIQRTYPDGQGGTRYPLKQKNPDAIIQDVKDGKFHMYTVRDKEGEMVAVFGSVIRDDILGQKGYAVELGRTGTRADKVNQLKEDDAPLRGISKLRLYHLLTDPRFIADPEVVGKSATFIYTDVRLAEQWNKDFEGGRGVQSVFFGGRKFGEKIGMGPATVGWRYNLDRTEPFAFLYKPTFPEDYLAKLVQKKLFIPDANDAERISKFLQGTFGVVPEIEHNGSVIHAEAVPADNIEVVLNLTPTKHDGTSDVFAKIDVVDTDSEFKQKAEGKITTMKLSNAIEKVKEGKIPFVETYVDATLGNGVTPEKIMGIVKTLKELGFVCNGWIPSSRGNGDSILISYAKLGPGANEPVPPDMPEKYYEGELAEVRQEALQIFEELRIAGPLD